MDLGPAGRGGARRRTRRRMAAVNSASRAQSNQEPQATAPTGTDPASLIKMLNALHSEGILTDQEFTDKKLKVTEMM